MFCPIYRAGKLKLKMKSYLCSRIFWLFVVFEDYSFKFRITNYFKVA